MTSSSITLVDASDPVMAASRDIADVRATVFNGDPTVCAEARSRMLALLDTRPRPLDRKERPGHFTGSAMVVDWSGSRTLMMLHAKLGIWVQPGGHADGNANLASVALREATEETGISGLRIWPEAIDFDVHRVAPPAEDAHEHHDVRYLAVAPSDAVVVANHESTDMGWFTADELPELGVDEGLRRLASSALTLARRVVGHG